MTENIRNLKSRAKITWLQIDSNGSSDLEELEVTTLNLSIMSTTGRRWNVLSLSMGFTAELTDYNIRINHSMMLL